MHDGSESALDSFTYRVSDYAGANSNTVTVSITVSPVNDPPVAYYDYGYAYAYQSTIIDLAWNDYDADDGLDLNSIQITMQPNIGWVQPMGSGQVEFYVFGGYGYAWAYFEYTISDYSGAVSYPAGVDVWIQGGYYYCQPFCP